MTDRELADFVRERGYAEHVARGGVAGLAALWKQFVGEVEHGYKLGLDDYRNDLDLRTVIAEAGLDKEVAEDDERFRRMLIHSDREVWESTVPDAFWTRGYPRNAHGELLEDLRTEELA